MLYYLDGDIFESPAKVLVNAVNTVGIMGKGIAKDFKAIYPEMFAQYQIFCETGRLTIGKLWLYKTPNKWVLNFGGLAKSFSSRLHRERAPKICRCLRRPGHQQHRLPAHRLRPRGIGLVEDRRAPNPEIPARPPDRYLPLLSAVAGASRASERRCDETLAEE